MVSVNGIIEIKRIHTDAQFTNIFKAYATDETQFVGSSTGVMTPNFTILSNSAITLGHMEIGHFQGACMTGWALSHSLMVYSPGNWPMPWNLSGNFLLRSPVDLIGTVFLGIGGAWVGISLAGSGLDDLDSTVHFDNFQSLAWWSPRMAGPGVCATYQQGFIWEGCALGETDCLMKGPWSDLKRGIWVPLWAVSLVLLTLRPARWPVLLI